jgi:hypothetical protein
LRDRPAAKASDDASSRGGNRTLEAPSGALRLIRPLPYLSATLGDARQGGRPPRRPITINVGLKPVGSRARLAAKRAGKPTRPTPSGRMVAASWIPACTLDNCSQPRYLVSRRARRSTGPPCRHRRPLHPTRPISLLASSPHPGFAPMTLRALASRLRPVHAPPVSGPQSPSAAPERPIAESEQGRTPQDSIPVRLVADGRRQP